MEILKIACVYIFLIPVNLAVSEVYARSLLFFEGVGRNWREIAVTFVYILLVGYLFVLLVVPYKLMHLASVHGGSASERMALLLFSFVSLIPGFILFRKRHLKKLKSMGFF